MQKYEWLQLKTTNIMLSWEWNVSIVRWLELFSFFDVTHFYGIYFPSVQSKALCSFLIWNVTAEYVCCMWDYYIKRTVLFCHWTQTIPSSNIYVCIYLFIFFFYISSTYLFFVFNLINLKYCTITFLMQNKYVSTNNYQQKESKLES